MEALDCIKNRRSIRKYADKPVTHEVLNQIVDVARFAPSWKNVQIARYIAVEDRKMIDKIAENCIYGFEFNAKTIKRCPVLMVVTMVEGLSGREKDGTFTTSKEDGWEMFDAGIATQTFCLAAEAVGVGTVILGIFDEEKIKETVNVPEGQSVAALIALGYPEFEPKCPPRKETEELLKFI